MYSSNLVRSKINRLVLENFRNYSFLDFSPKSNFIVITGPNGVGKTNLLEAISLMSPGRGMRGVKLSEMNNIDDSMSPWKITCDINSKYGHSRIITSFKSDMDSNKRQVDIDDVSVSHSELAKTINVSWLIPQMGHIFIDSSSSRRKFLDRMVMNFDSTHSKNLSSYEYYMRERSSLLKNNNYDKDWIAVLERNMSEVGVLIATSRVQFVDMLKETALDMKYDLPYFSAEVSGEIERKVYKVPSVQIEEEFMAILKENRSLDSLSKRTNAGIHRSDLLVYRGNARVKADMCSTGEQKFLLMSVFLTEIIAQIRYRNTMPVILLDDVVAHLDVKSQAIFFEIVSDIGAQVWVTSTFMESFDFLRNNAEFLRIENSKLLVCDNE
ncbi:MAG: DNA replication/repair protein RecF [Alphaproteobacteria bacterium]|nr:DNA replication/repair protein RecF [Alphaproteobacteria bacterium]